MYIFSMKKPKEDSLHILIFGAVIVMLIFLHGMYIQYGPWRGISARNDIGKVIKDIFKKDEFIGRIIDMSVNEEKGIFYVTIQKFEEYHDTHCDNGGDELCGIVNYFPVPTEIFYRAVLTGDTTVEFIVSPSVKLQKFTSHDVYAVYNFSQMEDALLYGIPSEEGANGFSNSWFFIILNKKNAITSLKQYYVP